MRAADGKDWLKHHRGKLIGALAGFALGVAIMTWGLLWTLFIALLVLVGYATGRYFDGEQDSVAEWIDRLIRSR